MPVPTFPLSLTVLSWILVPIPRLLAPHFHFGPALPLLFDSSVVAFRRRMLRIYGVRIYRHGDPNRLTRRWSQPRAVPMRSLTSIFHTLFAATRALARGGSARSR